MHTKKLVYNFYSLFPKKKKKFHLNSSILADLTNPKTNQNNAGFTKQEREGMTDLLGSGFVDTFRDLYPDKTGAYTFWSYFNNARGKNIGW